MKNFLADDELNLLASSRFHQWSALTRIVAAVALVLVLIGLGLEVRHLLPLHGP